MDWTPARYGWTRSAGSRRGSLAGRKTAGERKSLDMFDLEGLEGLDEEETRLDVHGPIDSS